MLDVFLKVEGALCLMLGLELRVLGIWYFVVSSLFDLDFRIKSCMVILLVLVILCAR